MPINHHAILDELKDSTDLDMQRQFEEEARFYYSTFSSMAPIAQGWGEQLNLFIDRQLPKSSKPLRIHDFTCGFGMQILPLSTFGHECSGSDASQTMLSFAPRLQAELDVSPIPLYQSNLCDPQVKLEVHSLDFAFSVSNDHFFSSEIDDTNTLCALKNIRRTLKPGAHFLFAIQPAIEFQEHKLPQHPLKTFSFKFDQQSERYIRYSQRYLWPDHPRLFRMDNKYEIQNKDGSFEEITFSTRRKVWTHNQIVECFKLAGFEIVFNHKVSTGNYREDWYLATSS